MQRSKKNRDCDGDTIKQSYQFLQEIARLTLVSLLVLVTLGDMSVLIVETILKPDQFGGIGLFAATLLPKGALIWVHNPLVDIAVTPEQYESLPRTFQALLDKHAYPRDLDVDDGVLEYNADNARFMNHSSQPNTYQDDHCRIFTARDVQPGEELTCDYLSFDPRCDLSWVKVLSPNVGAGAG
ncbi:MULTISPECIES: SET domain-containing protein [unclassified Bradyrhizobium]|uniref:SET domain-containing protein n=1 Tax=unclassified Bradyrhizobium TaxID=2631580 RepID=UPI0024798DDC|nr:MULTISPECIES: SET domain-containing protein [unclassified Bradyrhizobium]WGR72846.1 SET domain-containing protein [Bradyrhizobium sp. ISRA426]WGR77681.1 SET domain-containing protein [Bradyrhizobium sp. ISRA430]WGR88086.1 SET domain-containing protein [Bradyrhizobium sp. ISRA432]